MCVQKEEEATEPERFWASQAQALGTHCGYEYPDKKPVGTASSQMRARQASPYAPRKEPKVSVAGWASPDSLLGKFKIVFWDKHFPRNSIRSCWQIK